MPQYRSYAERRRDNSSDGERRRQERRRRQELSGGDDSYQRAERRQERRRDQELSGGAKSLPPALVAWQEAARRGRAAAQKQARDTDGPTRDVTLADGTVGKVYKTKPGRALELARQLYYSEDFRKEHPDANIPSEPRKRQSPGERSRRLHGMSTRDLHRPVTRSEAIKLFLEGYRRQASEGHTVNPDGKRRYGPTKLSWNKETKKMERVPNDRKGVIPTRVVKDFKNPGQALRSRMTRSAGKSPDDKGKVNGRKVISVCPDGVYTRAEAKAADCADSWKLRQRNAWKRYQMRDVSLHDSTESAESSELYKAAGTLAGDKTRKSRSRSKSPKRSRSKSPKRARKPAQKPAQKQESESDLELE